MFETQPPLFFYNPTRCIVTISVTIFNTILRLPNYQTEKIVSECRNNFRNVGGDGAKWGLLRRDGTTLQGKLFTNLDCARQNVTNDRQTSNRWGMARRSDCVIVHAFDVQA